MLSPTAAPNGITEASERMQTQPMPQAQSVTPRPPHVSARPAFLASILELPLPGAGMLYAGRVRTGFTWLAATLSLGFVALVALGRIPNRDYRTSVFGIYLLAVLTWLAARMVLAFAATHERNRAVGGAPNAQPDVSRAHGL